MDLFSHYFLKKSIKSCINCSVILSRMDIRLTASNYLGGPVYLCKILTHKFSFCSLELLCCVPQLTELTLTALKALHTVLLRFLGGSYLNVLI